MLYGQVYFSLLLDCSWRKLVDQSDESTLLDVVPREVAFYDIS